MNSVKNISILVVDDEKLIGMSLKRALETMGGYAVHCAFNGDDALRSLSERSYDVVITDLNLPDYKEFELVRQIREHSFTMPVIVMSAYYPDSSAGEMPLQDVFTCVHKPFDIQEVLRHIERAVTSDHQKD